jgi:hypothetical protein
VTSALTIWPTCDPHFLALAGAHTRARLEGRVDDVAVRPGRDEALLGQDDPAGDQRDHDHADGDGGVAHKAGFGAHPLPSTTQKTQ